MTRFTIERVIKTILKFWSLSRETKNSSRLSDSLRTRAGSYSMQFWIVMWISSIVDVLTFQWFDASVIFNLYSAVMMLGKLPDCMFSSS